jgi:hypothetical protein
MCYSNKTGRKLIKLLGSNTNANDSVAHAGYRALVSLKAVSFRPAH